MSNLPPTDKSPAELWAMMTQLPRPVRIIDFPREFEHGKVEIAIRVLTQEEQTRCLMDAYALTRKELEKNKLSLDMMTNAVQQIVEQQNSVEVLFAVCRNPTNLEQPFFRNREEIRKQLSPDEVACLLNEWFLFTAEASPIITAMSNDELEVWIDRIAEEGASIPLVRMTPVALNQLLSTMASRLVALRTVTESLGGEQSD